MQDTKPKWLQLTDELFWSIAVSGLDLLNPQNAADPDVAAVAFCALLHFGDCFQAVNSVNKEGKHSVAVCLLRQAVEALTMIDLGLQPSQYSEPLIEAWKSGKKNQGQIRASLERDIWPKYGRGLWKETWSDYFGNLSRAVQPYAHFSYELMGWRMSSFGFDGKSQFLVTMNPNNYDPVKAIRITLLLSLTGWTLGRLLVAQGSRSTAIQHADAIQEWGEELSNSKLLFREGPWGDQLLPHVLFWPGSNWLDS